MNTEDKPSLRFKTFYILEKNEGNHTLSSLIDYFLIGLIILNVLAVIFETVDSFYNQYSIQLYWLEMFSVIIFTVEYLMRTWSCVENSDFDKQTSNNTKRLKFIFTPMAIIDLLAILPFYLAFLMQIDLRFLRALRLLRIFKLTRYSAAMTTLLRVLKEERKKFVAVIFIMLIIMVIAASGIYLVENKLQPDKFGSIPESMWWAIVTMTTVGYGDVTPITGIGKFFAACIMIAGIILVALQTAILASGFSDNLKRNRKAMTKKLEAVLEDGIIDKQERLELDQMSEQLGVSKEVENEIHQSLVENKESEISSCPHCGKSLKD